MTEVQFKKGEVIFYEGDDGKSLYQVIDGTVGIYVNFGDDNEQKLTEIKKGGFFGEMAVIEAYPRSATAVAIDDVKALEILSGEVNDYLKSEPEKIIDIMKHLSSRIRALTDDYSEVSATIKELKPGEQDSSERSEGLIARIKKFADVYKNSKNAANFMSVESKNKIARNSHSEGYTKNVDLYSEGTIIFKEDETGNRMYDIHTGKVGIYKGYGTPDEKLLATLYPNEFFGEMGLIESDKRSATAVVLEDDTTLEAISGNDLVDLFENNPPKLEMILAHVSYRLRKLTNEYMNACKLVAEISDAEDTDSISAELKERAASYVAKFYD
ncbi:MAG: cyclic nucleotide-binding domain-containing protein [Lachnospiraceae bacterium]|nr:cyclic nucleotide-binding domain-containing protein [Lachnospiraceae bacterium]